MQRQYAEFGAERMAGGCGLAFGDAYGFRGAEKARISQATGELFILGAELGFGCVVFVISSLEWTLDRFRPTDPLW